MMPCMDTIRTALDRIEDGYARVNDADTGRAIGSVTREKTGSLRTSVTWFAYRGSVQVGHGDTRSDAVTVVREATEAYRAKLAAFRNR